MAIILWILLFMFLVLIHEIWHFTAAKKSWVKVQEFGIWIPPKICTIAKDKSWTEYTLNLLPLGGFVKLKWEDPKDPDEFYADDSFIKGKFWNKIIILLWGVLMNFVFAWLFFTITLSVGTKPISIIPENALNTNVNSYLVPTMSFLQEEGFIEGEITDSPAEVTFVWEGLIAESISLQTGDIILAVNNESVNTWTLGTELQKNIWQDVTLLYQRWDKVNKANFTCPEDSCILGITLSSDDDISIKDIQFPIHKAAWIWLREVWVQSKLTLNALGTLWAKLLSFNRAEIQSGLSRVTGPVWAVKFGEVLLKEWGWIVFMWFAGMISLALALFNVLPIPALDGGRLLGVLIQKIFRLKPEKYFNIEAYINLIFFVLLMWMWIYIIFKDLVQFWWVNIPFIG